MVPAINNTIDLGSSAKTFRNIFLSGPTYEKVTVINNATGIVNHNTAVSSIWLHTNLLADFTADFTNVTLMTGSVTNLTLICHQSSVARYPSACRINGSTVTVNWSDGTIPTPTANKKEFYSFTILNNNGSFTVYGGISLYG